MLTVINIIYKPDALYNINHYQRNEQKCSIDKDYEKQIN